MYKFLKARLVKSKTKGTKNDGKKGKNKHKEKNNRALALDLQQRVGYQDPEFLYPTMIPEPDYSDHDDDDNSSRNRKNATASTTPDSESHLIVPKKPHNPCMESVERQNLHRELKFNQKMGVKVIGQKSELTRALEKHKEVQVEKEMKEKKAKDRTSFQKALDTRAKRLEDLEKQSYRETEPSSEESEFFKVHAKVRARIDSGGTRIEAQ